ncbi:MAG: hypothetical protein ACKV1O_14815 [Saprospiraceae bacterium]
MKEEEKYSSIDYRISGDLNSIKRKPQKEYYKVILYLVGFCLAISLLSLYLLYSSNDELKSDNMRLKINNMRFLKQVDKSTSVIDSLNKINITILTNYLSNSDLKRINDDIQQINDNSKRIEFENQLMRELKIDE